MRDFPAYLDSNRFLSNRPGTTVFFPVVDLSHQYINGLMYLLTQPEKARPAIIDDRNFYRPAGTKEWIRNGFLNEDIKVPLGAIYQMRTEIEASLLMQNLFLVTEAMGLGAWIHGAISGPDGRPQVPRQVRQHAGLRLRLAEMEADGPAALAHAADPGDAGRAQPRRRPAPQGRAIDHGEMPAELRQHGGGGRCGREGEVRRGRPLQRPYSSASTRATSAPATSTRRRSTKRT